MKTYLTNEVWVQDINMPILDGLQATMQIRSIERARMAHDQASKEHPDEKPPSMYRQGHEVHAGRESVSLCSILRVPIVGVSACSKTEQLMSAKSDGLLPDHLTGRHFFTQYTRLHLSTDVTHFAELIAFIRSYACLLR